MRTFPLLVMLLLLLRVPAFAQTPEYRVKAAMLANFALFVDWPAAAFPSAASPFVVYVVGDDPFGPWLKVEMGPRIGSHPVQIRHAEKVENVRECHIVFVGRSEQPRLKQALAALQKTGALIVSDAERPNEFCRDGGMVALVMEGGKVRFELNAGAAAKAGLKLDSKLKRVARSAECGEE